MAALHHSRAGRNRMTSSGNDPARRIGRVGRRRLLGLAGVSTAALAFGISSPAHAELGTGRRVPANPFALGVASGDPAPDGMVLWTRLAPEPLAADGRGGMPQQDYQVSWEVAEDEQFGSVVASGQALASPDLGHSVHPEVTGLSPNREYFYRFRAGNEISPVGRTRTMPARDSMPDQLDLVTVSCQAWYHGYFTGYEHMLADDPDLVLFLGDYIYEYGITESNFWREGASLPPSEHSAETITLEQYRLRYSLFKNEPALQAMHAAAPWVLTTDDHEVVNNYADEIGGGVPPEEFLLRRAAAYQAYYENVPLRAAQRPDGPDLPLYRRLHYGRLAQFDVLDTRQYRDDYPCDEVIGDCPERHNPERSILGTDQETWLYDGIASSDAVWNTLVQQTVLARIDRDPEEGEIFSTDQWDGFPAAQQRLWDAYRTNGIQNVVSFPGDIHSHVAIDLKEDFTDPDSATIGVEVGGGSIASNGNGSEHNQFTDLWMANDHVRYFNGLRGYLRCTLTPSELRADYRVMPYIQRTGAPIETAASFVTEAGNPGLQDP